MLLGGPHAQIIENGHPRRLDNGQPETRYLFVPVAEAELLDTWHVRVCAARGRTTSPSMMSSCPRSAAQGENSLLIETGPLYQITRGLFASVTLPCPWAWPAPAWPRSMSWRGQDTAVRVWLLREQPMIQVDVGHAEANLRSAGLS